MMEDVERVHGMRGPALDGDRPRKEDRGADAEHRHEGNGGTQVEGCAEDESNASIVAIGVPLAKPSARFPIAPRSAA